MLKQSITFEDLDGNEITEDFYFNINQAELTEMMLNRAENPEVWIKRIERSDRGDVVYPEFKKLILSSVGKRSDDGKRFIKNDEIRSEFEESNAFGEFLVSLLTGQIDPAAFVRGLMPAKLQRQIAEADAAAASGKLPEVAELPEKAEPKLVQSTNPTAEGVPTSGALAEEQAPAWVRENRDPTPAEIRSMSHEELQAVTLRKMRQQ